MIEKLSQKDIRILKIGAVCVVAILVFVFASKWLDRWAEARASLAEVKNKLELIDVEKAKQAGLMSIVPKFEMPQKEETQKFLFRDKLDEQFAAHEMQRQMQVYPGARFACQPERQSLSGWRRRAANKMRYEEFSTS